MSTAYSQMIQKKKVPFLYKKKDKNFDRLKTTKPMLYISTAFDTGSFSLNLKSKF